MFGGNSRVLLGQGGISEQGELVILKELGQAWRVLKPFLAWPTLIGIFITARMLWPANAWVVAFFALTGIFLAGFTFYLYRRRAMLDQVHAALTYLLAAGIVSYVDMVGRNSPVMFMSIFVIPLLCLTWSIRAAMHHKEIVEQDNLTTIFANASMPGTKMTVNPAVPDVTGQVRRVTGKFHMPGGKLSIEEATKQKLKMEGSFHFPPETMTLFPDRDDAADIGFVWSDPRSLDKPLTWPGPSIKSGASIALPLNLGLYQDGLPLLVPITETHLQVMGMTGSGKSKAAQIILAEGITRRDVVFMGIDITKGEQTLGPFRNAMFRVATNPKEAKKLLVDINNVIRPRTDYLTEHGLSKWEENCGLSYMVVIIEEAPAVIESLGRTGKKAWLAALKAARSAGITFVISLQRSDWSELPTLARGQLGHMCFGVANAGDARFGLSATQIKLEAKPSLWNRRSPGKTYVDVPGIDEEKVAMPARVFFIGEDSDAIRDYANRYPVSPIDTFTASAIEHGEADVITDPGKSAVVPYHKAKEMHDKFRTWVIENGDAPFGIKTANEYADSIGRGVGWAYSKINALIEEGLLERTDKPGVATWQLSENYHKADRFIQSGAERAEQYGAPFDPELTPDQLLPLYLEDNCYYCGMVIVDREIDHKIPLSRNGPHSLENFAASCALCNGRKSNQTEEEFVARMAK